MKFKNESSIGITEEQIIKMAFRKIVQDDFAEIKGELIQLREAVTDLMTKRVANDG